MPKRRIIRRRNKAVKRKTVSSSSLKSHDQQLNENDDMISNCEKVRNRQKNNGKSAKKLWKNETVSKNETV